jgi:hypothetical protein
MFGAPALFGSYKKKSGGVLIFGEGFVMELAMRNGSPNQVPCQGNQHGKPIHATTLGLGGLDHRQVQKRWPFGSLNGVTLSEAELQAWARFQICGHF